MRRPTCLNSSATDIVLVTLPSTAVETAIAQCTSRWAMARGHRLNTSIVLAAVHGLSGLFRPVVEPSLSRPLAPSRPVPNKPSRFCGRKATWSQSRPPSTVRSASQFGFGGWDHTSELHPLNGASLIAFCCFCCLLLMRPA